MDASKRYDVLVVGGGNAALCAAIGAAREGASVLVVNGGVKTGHGAEQKSATVAPA